MNSGIFLINKDKGISSNQAIQKIKKKARYKKDWPFWHVRSFSRGSINLWNK